jgi:excisionase family DNA binding protein
MPELLTAEQLAHRLQVSPRTVKQWARTGRIPELRLSAKVRRFDLAEVVQALRPREAQAEVSNAD